MSLPAAQQPLVWRILTLSEAEQKTLQEWLTVIVICGASVRLTPHEAEAIVKGPSLI